MALWCYKWANSRSALYRAETIRDQLFVWNFLFINNGRHRPTALYRFPRSIGPRYNGAAVYFLKSLHWPSRLSYGLLYAEAVRLNPAGAEFFTSNSLSLFCCLNTIDIVLKRPYSGRSLKTSWRTSKPVGNGS